MGKVVQNYHEIHAANTSIGTTKTAFWTKAEPLAVSVGNDILVEFGIQCQNSTNLYGGGYIYLEYSHNASDWTEVGNTGYMQTMDQDYNSGAVFSYERNHMTAKIENYQYDTFYFRLLGKSYSGTCGFGNSIGTSNGDDGVNRFRRYINIREINND